MTALERDELGERFLRAMHRHSGVIQAMSDGVSRDSFKFGCQSAWDYCVNFYNKHDRPPHLSDIRDSTGVNLRAVKPEPYQYVLKQLRLRAKREQLFERLEEIAVKAEDGEVETAQALLISCASEMQEDADGGDRGAYNSEYDKALEFYEKQFNGADSESVKTPWDTLNMSVGNLVKGTLTIFLASPGSGKTWLTCAMAYFAALQGKRVLLLSMEMTRSQISRRLDSILCELPFSDVRDIGTKYGKRNTYFVLRRRLPFRRKAMKGELIVKDESRIHTPEQLLSECYKGQYDFVVVDGAYRMDTGNKFDNSFDVQRKVASKLQTYAKLLKIPIAATSQYNEQRDTKGQRRTEMALEHARYSKELGTNADVVVGLQQKVEGYGEYALEFQVLKIRDGSDRGERSFVAKWNINAHLFYDKFGEKEADTLTADDETISYGDI